MAIAVLGIDLAKNVFALHGVDEAGKPALVRSRVARARLLELVAALPPCLIGLEACSGAHHWARELSKAGHTVRLMAPKFVVPYRLAGKYGKNDATDAAAICEAVTRPGMRFVPTKTPAQQGQLMVHRVRQALVVQRTATFNRIRGLLAELGVVLAPGTCVLRREAARYLPTLPGDAATVLADLLAEVARLDERIARYDRHITRMAHETPAVRQLMQLNGIGNTTATAIVSTLGDGRDFANGRQFAAWLGLVPRQYSSGGKPRLGRITRTGDAYLRGLLVMGAKAVLAAAMKTAPNATSTRQSATGRWARALVARRGYWRAVIAIAAKNARLSWAVLQRGAAFAMPV